MHYSSCITSGDRSYCWWGGRCCCLLSHGFLSCITPEQPHRHKKALVLSFDLHYLHHINVFDFDLSIAYSARIQYTLGVVLTLVIYEVKPHFNTLQRNEIVIYMNNSKILIQDHNKTCSGSKQHLTGLN